MTATIYLVRHGETTWNRSGRMHGRGDSPLTLHGARQAESTGQHLQARLDGTDIRFWSSPQGRSRQTTAIICDVLSHDYEEVVFDDRLADISLGDRDGYAGWAQLAQDYPEEAEQRRLNPWHYRHPNGESSQMVQDRVSPLLASWTAGGGVHVVVSHGVPIKILRGLYLGLSQEQTYQLARPQNAFHQLHGDRIAEIGIGLS